MAARKPNVLFLLTDMQRADTIHALGNVHIQTPHLDSLVCEGTAFTNAFTPSPICIAARCSMHYGLYPQKTGVYTNGRMMDDNGRSMPAVLGDAGYRTHAVGKCHFTPSRFTALRGFQSKQRQEEVVADPTLDDYIAWLQDHGYDYYEAHGARSEMYYIPQISSLPVEAHPTQWIGDQSCRFINDNADTGKPWFLFASFIHPHPPFALPKPWHKLYRAWDMPEPFLPENYQALRTWADRFGTHGKFRDCGMDMQLARTIIAYYYGCVSFVDYQIGRILNLLRKANAYEDTIILFASDHGEYLGDYGTYGKRSMLDASARVPLIVRYPERFGKGCRCATAVSLVDLFPTFLAAAGIPGKQIELDGLDLASIANNEATDRIVYSQYDKVEKAIYMAANKDWKYVYSAGDDMEFLFDRNRDPKETRNVVAEANAAAAMHTLRDNLLDYLKRRGLIESFVEQECGLTWKKYARIDESYMASPNEKLFKQESPSYEMNIPPYETKPVQQFIR